MTYPRVNKLRRPPRVGSRRQFAGRHVEYGVKLADYDAVREALLWTLEQALEDEFTPAVREARTICYDELAGEMKAAVSP